MTVIYVSVITVLYAMGNLSNVPLEQAEKSLFSRGLNFIPTAPDLIQKELLDSFDEFVTRLRCNI